MAPSQSAGQPSLNARTVERLSIAAHPADTRVLNTPALSAALRARNMGDVAVILKVMPESPDVNLEEMQKAIRAQVKGVNDIKVEPIGFGLSALKVAVVTQDGAGVEDVIKAQFDGIAGLESVEVEGLTLL